MGYAIGLLATAVAIRAVDSGLFTGTIATYAMTLLEANCFLGTVLALAALLANIPRRSRYVKVRKEWK